ncbi:hypothetical protein CC78DRAFT_233649 [Lojkania enalia]|uniref:Uncharacterized protein n=1 Tax=Lojkania enalia TaxID=147567 RepID=A0A9P4KE04_9PLEO|nr:hypothetical protein CC78DRAFT_233649 [Didymosphaeria enalia]
MSWTYAYHQINQSFERIAIWYREFMHRTEQAFREMHQRVTYLEEHHAWPGPSDEQVERILRKILAEKFGNAGVELADNPNTTNERPYFVQKPNDDLAFPKPIPIDGASLAVDPEAIPSKTYGQTFQMLESKLSSFPNMDAQMNSANDHSQESRAIPAQSKAITQSPGNQHHIRPW